MRSSIIQFGGLGNQMFIYAFYHSLLRSGKNAIIDASLYNMLEMHNGYELPCIFNIEEPAVSRKGIHLLWLRLLLHFKPRLLVKVDHDIYDENVYACNKPYFTGYWQTEKYFTKYKDDILKFFQFKCISGENIRIADDMQKCNSVSLHIRRGDYLQSPNVGGLCSEEYYKSAVDIIKSKVRNPHFYIFSNDPEWSQNFAKKLEIEYTIIKHNTGPNSYQDMYLISKCRHNVLANSSFSWWGAYLNQHDEAIKIAPRVWNRSYCEQYNKDATPSNWLRIEN